MDDPPSPHIGLSLARLSFFRANAGAFLQFEVLLLRLCLLLVLDTLLIFSPSLQLCSEIVALSYCLHEQLSYSCGLHSSLPQILNRWDISFVSLQQSTFRLQLWLSYPEGFWHPNSWQLRILCCSLAVQSAYLVKFFLLPEEVFLQQSAAPVASLYWWLHSMVDP